MIDFLVIGAQKCASSWLYYCLKDHPELNLPQKKKEVEYIGGELYKKNGGIDWYHNLFDKKPNQINGDVSVEYLFDANSPEEIHKHYSNCKFVVLLRNPTERLKSAYFWYRRKSIIGEETVISDEIVNFVNGVTVSPLVADLFSRGYYHQQIINFTRYFDLSQFCFVLFDQIQLKPIETIQEIYSFLDVNTEFIPPSISKRPKKNSYNPILIKLESLFSKQRWASFLLDILNQSIANNKKSSEDRHIFNKDIDFQIRRHYKEHNDEVYNFLNASNCRIIGNINDIKKWN